MDLHLIPFENMYNFSDPSLALSRWIDLFLDVINKHAPLQKKLVKQQTVVEHQYKASHVTERQI